MNIVILLSIIFGLSAQDILRKAYNRSMGSGGAFFFSAVSAFTAMVFFLVLGKNMQWNTLYLPYSLTFGISYAVAAAGAVLAVSVGPLSITALVISFSLMIPTLYGIVFLEEPAGIGFVAGVIFLSISLVMVNIKKGEEKINIKWIVFASAAFVANGLCTVIQTMEQRALDGAYKSEFMVVALLFVSVTLGILSVATERKIFCTGSGLKPMYCILNGIANGAVNLFVMILSRRMPVSLMFPSVSAGGLVLTYGISTVFYKERLSRIQTIGFAFGLVAVVLLNI